MRHIEVEYLDGRHAFIDNHFLQILIDSKRIKRFFRPSEKRWVTIGIDSIRGWGGNYWGFERRGTGRTERKIPWRERHPSPPTA